MLFFGSAGLDTVQLIIGAVGASGLGGGLVAFRKLRPDMDTAAVTQSQGAVETMAILQQQLERDRNSWRERAMHAESEARRLTDELEKCQRASHRQPRR